VVNLVPVEPRQIARGPTSGQSIGCLSQPPILDRAARRDSGGTSRDVRVSVANWGDDELREIRQPDQTLCGVITYLRAKILGCRISRSRRPPIGPRLTRHLG